MTKVETLRAVVGLTLSSQRLLSLTSGGGLQRDTLSVFEHGAGSTTRPSIGEDRCVFLQISSELFLAGVQTLREACGQAESIRTEIRTWSCCFPAVSGSRVCVSAEGSPHLGLRLHGYSPEGLRPKLSPSSPAENSRFILETSELSRLIAHGWGKIDRQYDKRSKVSESGWAASRN
ncbi:hypothetical protein Bbelb_249550 [Branchiostoma belcheri]|nr:hypothetical protein Bbelb_249550 [Branchiostoma belcheri]